MEGSDNENNWPVHARVDGPVVMIGFGSIGQGVLPLLERHIDFDPKKFTVVSPMALHSELLEERNLRFICLALTSENYREVLTPLLTKGPGRGLVVNVSVDTSSVDLVDLCKDLEAYYIDTVVEPWPGLYYSTTCGVEKRTNYAMREDMLELRRRRPGGVTAVSACGANPGMISWLAKQALLNVARDTGVSCDPEPSTREEWAELMQRVGVKGIHVAENDTQRSSRGKSSAEFVNTWSVDGFVAEGLQPAELGWGTHEKALPPDGHTHSSGCGAAIYLMRPGAGTLVRSWTPMTGPQHAFLITHNEAISISDYFTLRNAEGAVVYRPTCHYAYRPCDDAVLSIHEMAGRAWAHPQAKRILDEDEICGGTDELGVLLYGHAKNAYWYGSQLSIEETRSLAPYQNATGLQVTTAMLAAIVWMLENPDVGIVEADDLDFRRCLEIQERYLGSTMVGHYTDWTPLEGRPGLFPEDLDTSDPWQFSNVLV